MEQVRFCTAPDGVRLAYAETGSGPPMLKAQHWMTHLEHDAGVWAHLVREFGRRFHFVRFDQRGCGLSDREVPDISFEAWVRDLEVVADAARLERFALLGISQGAAIAVAYAARHPERVSHLVLYGGFAHGMVGRDLSVRQRETFDTLAKLIELGWGRDDPSFRQVFATQFMPGAGIDVLRAFNEMMRVSSAPETAARIYRTVGQIDVRDEAPRVRCPTLVAHARRDARIPFEEGRQLAGLIPDARFVPLDSANHILLEDEPAWRQLLAAVDEFLPPAAAAAGEFSGLTAREREVLELIAQGLDNAQIAARLELSEKTVRNNITHIFDKIGVENRSQAIVLARERGLGQARRP
jgi:pimeloyl-ACP methyl ester carboxylesterase/DNA-binding CsgD family transcriptional regulator